MNKAEELKYLVQLQSAALDWRLSENDDRDPIRLEVEQRIAKLLGDVPEIIDGREQNVRRTEQMQKARQKYQEGKVRVGKTWYSRELVEKQMLGPNKFKWVLKQTAVSEQPEDEHQCLSY